MSTHPTEGVTGKVVVVTGAGSGIGAATARLLSRRGATLVLAGRRAEVVEAVAASIRDDGGRATSAHVDVTRLADVQHLVARTVEQHGRLDVVVNNAGVAPIGPVDDLDTEGWAAMVQVNLVGVLNGVAAALPVFREQGRGHVVTVASLAGTIGVTPTLAVYSATKNAVRTFMEGLRAESTDGVLRTTTISPGFVRTDLADSMPEDLRQQTRASMSRMGIPAEAVARTVAFAIEQPDDVEISSLVVAPTVQG